MPASAAAAVASLQVIGLGKDKQPILDREILRLHLRAERRFSLAAVGCFVDRVGHVRHWEHGGQLFPDDLS
jgi:hypothetical protein